MKSPLTSQLGHVSYVTPHICMEMKNASSCCLPLGPLMECCLSCRANRAGEDALISIPLQEVMDGDDAMLQGEAGGASALYTLHEFLVTPGY